MFESFTSKKGFTLLEILMVIIIIGILAALAIPQYMKVASKGHASEAVSNIGTIKGAELRYYAEYGSLLTGSNLEDLDTEIPNSAEGDKNAKFRYSVGGSDADSMTITATGTEPETDNIEIIYHGDTGEIEKNFDK